MNQCKTEGCDGAHKAFGLCNKCYLKQRRGKDPSKKSQREKSVRERFDEKLSPPDPVTGCMEWNGCRVNGGYGVMTVSRENVMAHRMAYELKYGPIPEGALVLHDCDNPPCCNWEHLFLGSYHDNTEDMVAKGRGNPARGERNPTAKLTEEDVRAIKDRIKNGETQRSIAAALSVNQSTIAKIKSGERWAHVH